MSKLFYGTQESIDTQPIMNSAINCAFREIDFDFMGYNNEQVKGFFKKLAELQLNSVAGFSFQRLNIPADVKLALASQLIAYLGRLEEQGALVRTEVFNGYLELKPINFEEI